MTFLQVLADNGLTDTYVETVDGELVKEIHVDSIVDYVNSAPLIVKEKIDEQTSKIDDKEGLKNYLSQLAEGL